MPRKVKVVALMKFQTHVYFLKALGLFLIIDYRARPDPKSWVVVKRLLNGLKLIIEPFHGQPFIGVVRVLEHYKPHQSEHERINVVKIYPD